MSGSRPRLRGSPEPLRLESRNVHRRDAFEKGTVMTYLRLFVPALVLLLCAPALAAAQTDLTGDWVLTITSPQGPRDLSAKLKQDGEKLTGTVVTPRGEAALEGTITGPDVKIA